MSKHKNRADIIRTLMDITGLTYQQLNYRLSDMQKAGYVDAALEGDQQAINMVVDNCLEQEVPEKTDPKPKYTKRSKAVSNRERISIAFWFVHQVGGLAKARKALDLVEKVNAGFEAIELEAKNEA